MTARRRWWIAGASIVIVLGVLAFLRFGARGTPVDVIAATEAAVDLRVTGPASVQPRAPVLLSARTTSTVVAVNADQGDAVKRGQILVQLDDRDLVARRAAAMQAQETIRRNITVAETNVAKAQSDFELARENHRRDREIFNAGYVSAAALDAVRAAERSAEAGLANAGAALAARQSEALAIAQDARFADAQLAYARIVSPIDGIVVQRLMEPGNTAVPGSPILKIVDPAAVWIVARIDESLISQVAPGMPASIRLRSGETVSGKVTRVARQSDAATRELPVEITPDTLPERIAIDQEAFVTIVAGTTSGVTVPAATILQRDGRTGVLVVRDGHARFVAVATGASDGTRVVVRSGLSAGEQVVSDPARVRDNARVTIATAGQ